MTNTDYEILRISKAKRRDDELAIGLARDAVSVSIHSFAVAGLPRVERRLACGANFVAAGVVDALLDAMAFFGRLHNGRRRKVRPDVAASEAQNGSRDQDVFDAHAVAIRPQGKEEVKALTGR